MRKQIPKTIESLVGFWLQRNCRFSSDFIKKILVGWAQIVGARLASFSTPSKIILEKVGNNSSYTLLIIAYSSSAAFQLQTIEQEIIKNVKVNIGYCPFYKIKVLQKACEI